MESEHASERLARLAALTATAEANAVRLATLLLTLLIIAVSSRVRHRRVNRQVVPSPRETLLPRLTAAQQLAVAYPPDILPGGCDVESPYGTVRVYEWGPKDGPKVLCVHGITTPCISLGALAHGLVERGCRVMLLDLWGRGYSDGCVDLPHDDRLYASEILVALASSPLSWTGAGAGGGFYLVGYSLGGGIAAAFTSHFSRLVRSLVLLAPSGVVRPEHMHGRSKILFAAGLVPERIMYWLIKRRLHAGPIRRPVPATPAALVASDATPTKIKRRPLSYVRPDLTTDGALAWQLDAHQGFMPAFLSSLRFAPITGQAAVWQRLGSRRTDKILVVGGRYDPVILAPELEADAKRLLGAERVEWRLFDSAHDFPTTHADDLVHVLCDFWRL